MDLLTLECKADLKIQYLVICYVNIMNKSHMCISQKIHKNMTKIQT